MKVKDLKGLSSQDLITKEKSLKKELFDLNYQKKIGQVEKPSQFGSIRRQIARIMTILKERELENERSNSKNK